MRDVLLKVSALGVSFSLPSALLRKRRQLTAIEHVSFELCAGEALGIVGESGCGKSTLLRAILQLVRPTEGSVVWLSNTLETLSSAQLRPLRRDMQVVLQDPFASLDPRMTVAKAVAEPLRIHRPELGREARLQAVREMLSRVGLSGDVMGRYPHELSGGQCQRVAIARAMILRPRLLICDEPLSALDVSIQAQVLNLLMELRREHPMSLLFVSHNLAVVRRLCDRVLVLYLGRMMELASTESIYTNPLHPYTRSLLDAIPVPDPDIQPRRLRRDLEGELPSAFSRPGGCVFQTRCPQAVEICRQSVPAWEAADGGRWVACHRWRDLSGPPPTPDGRPETADVSPT